MCSRELSAHRRWIGRVLDSKAANLVNQGEPPLSFQIVVTHAIVNDATRDHSYVELLRGAG
jgi:hypothetical protein